MAQTCAGRCQWWCSSSLPEACCFHKTPPSRAGHCGSGPTPPDRRGPTSGSPDLQQHHDMCTPQLASVKAQPTWLPPKSSRLYVCIARHVEPTHAGSFNASSKTYKIHHSTPHHACRISNAMDGGHAAQSPAKAKLEWPKDQAK
jgi:hypothetical protein